MTNLPRTARTGLAAILAACAALPAAAQDSEILWARYVDVDTLDPHRATSTLSLQVWSLIYDTLMATDADGNPVPNLATSHEASQDGTE